MAERPDSPARQRPAVGAPPARRPLVVAVVLVPGAAAANKSLGPQALEIPRGKRCSRCCSAFGGGRGGCRAMQDEILKRCAESGALALLVPFRRV